MTPTQRKNGQKVYGAALALAVERGGRWVAVFSVADVAKRAGVSKPTAQKYMLVMMQNDLIDKSPHYPGSHLYRWIAGA